MRFIRGLELLLVVVLSSCGLQTNPPPTLTSLSPSTATREGPAFTLMVSGSNFVSGSFVQWNGSARPTTFVSSTQLAPLAFNVPCVLAAQGPAATQTRARLGAYYFDGWSGPLTNFHFQGLPNGPYAVREPLSGWRDNNECAVEQQLAWASSFGIKFFVFDWYYNASSVDPGEDLNGAFEIARLLPDHPGMQGGFNRSSQHLDSRELRWEKRNVDGHIALDVLQCVHRVEQLLGGVSIGTGSGKRLVEECRAKTLGRLLAFPRLLGRDGSVKVAACHRSTWPHFRGGICHLSNEKRSRSCTLSVSGSERSLGESIVAHRRSHESCVETPRPEVNIARRPPSGTLTGKQSGPSWRSSLQMMNCVGTSRTGSQA